MSSCTFSSSTWKSGSVETAVSDTDPGMLESLEAVFGTASSSLLLGDPLFGERLPPLLPGVEYRNGDSGKNKLWPVLVEIVAICFGNKLSGPDTWPTSNFGWLVSMFPISFPAEEFGDGKGKTGCTLVEGGVAGGVIIPDEMEPV